MKPNVKNNLNITKLFEVPYGSKIQLIDFYMFDLHQRIRLCTKCVITAFGFTDDSFIPARILEYRQPCSIHKDISIGQLFILNTNCWVKTVNES